MASASVANPTNTAVAFLPDIVPPPVSLVAVHG
jgi:hypothetical protein